MQKQHSPFRKVPSPLKAGANAFRLLDDGIWHALNKPADKLSDKTGYTKVGIASSVLFVGYAASDISDCIRKNDMRPLTYDVPYDAVAALVVRRFSGKYNKSSVIRSDGQAVDFRDLLMRTTRLPMVLVGIGLAIVSSTSIGIFLTCWGVYNYLLSSSNGMGHKAKNWVKDKAIAAARLLKGVVSPAPALAPVPVSASTICAEN